MNRKRTLLFLSGLITLSLFSACDGIFANLYDEPSSDSKSEYGFILVDNETRTGRIYLDATSYAEWHYIDLHGKQITTTAVDATAPESWDFALHRYDAKTNRGAVWETTAGDLASIPAADSWPSAGFVADEWTTDRITVDMSQMMDGIILYAEDYYNPILSRWLDVDTSTMPPIYTLSGRVYLLRLADGTHAALRLTNFMNDAAVKGFMTIDYRYPVEP